MTLSPQLGDFARAWVKEDGIEFDVFLDLGNAVARDWGLVFPLGDELSALYRDRLGIDLVRYNGDESWELAIPATFVIDRDGTIAWGSAHPDYTVRPEPSEVLAAIP